MGTHDGAITRDWGDGTHVFRLPVSQLLELQDLCNAGPAEIYDRLLQHKWRYQDLRETIRLGLIGGGMGPQEALARIKRYVEPPQPLLDSVPVALEILGMALVGPADAGAGADDQPAGKAQAAAGHDGSPLPPSTEPAAPSGSARTT